MMPITPDLLDELLKDYKSPDDMFGDDGFLLKLLYLALHNIAKKWTMPIPTLESGDAGFCDHL
jgi:transposase-like protein